MVGVTQPIRRQAETGASQESCEEQLQLGEFKMKVSLHESPARPTKSLSLAADIFVVFQFK